MKVLLNQTLADIEGKTIREGGEEKGVEFTLKKIVINALLGNYQDEVNLSGEEKLKRWEMALTIKTAESTLDLKSEDIALIKKLIAKLYAVTIVGQAWKMLEKEVVEEYVDKKGSILDA